MNLDGYVFISFLLVAFVLLIIAESSNYWVEFGTFGSSYQGLWNACFNFGRSNMKQCIALDDVSDSVHITRAFIAVATLGFVVVFGLVFLVETNLMKRTRLPGMACLLPIFSELIAMASFTVEVYKNLPGVNSVRFAWSYFMGWASLAIVFAGMLIRLRDDTRSYDAMQLQ